MNPVEFEGSRWIGKPKDMKDEECFGIPAKDGHEPLTGLQWIEKNREMLISKEINIAELLDEFAKQFKSVSFFGVPAYENYDNANHHFWLTAWKPSYEDIQAINRGEPFYIKTLSGGLPPMMVFTLDENGNCNDEPY